MTSDKFVHASFSLPHSRVRASCCLQLLNRISSSLWCVRCQSAMIKCDGEGILHETTTVKFECECAMVKFECHCTIYASSRVGFFRSLHSFTTWPLSVFVTVIVILFLRLWFFPLFDFCQVFCPLLFAMLVKRAWIGRGVGVTHQACFTDQIAESHKFLLISFHLAVFLLLILQVSCFLPFDVIHCFLSWMPWFIGNKFDQWLFCVWFYQSLW